MTVMYCWIYAVLALALQCRHLATATDGFLFKSLSGCAESFEFRGNSTPYLKSRSKLDCAKSCSRDPKCLGFNLCETGSPDSPVPFLCQLVSQWSQDSCGLLSPAPGCSFWKMDIPCVHGSVNTTTRRCDCQPGFAGQACERRIRDCQEGSEMGMTGIEEHFLIQPLGAPAAFLTRCDFRHGLTVVVRRNKFCTASDPFLTGTWQKLKTHQGDCASCCFIGLDNLYYLLNQGINYDLKVGVYQTWSAFYSILYPDVRMQNTSGRYTLTWANPLADPGIEDGFLPGGNQKFCSSDHDCSGCAAGAGHAGWFDDSGAGCQEAKGLGQPLQWPVGGSLQNVVHVVFEAFRA